MMLHQKYFHKNSDKLQWDRYYVIVIFLLALILRICFVVQFNIINSPTEYLSGDAFEYYTVSVNLITGSGWLSPDMGGSFYQDAPIYPLFLAFILIIFGKSFLIITIIQSIISAITCLIIFLIGKMIFNVRTGLLAASIAAIYPYFIFYTSKILTETVAIFLTTTLLLQFIRFEQNCSFKNMILAGLIWGLTTLTRPEAYVFFPLLFIWILPLFKNKVKGFFVFFIIFLTFLLTVLPWHIYQSHKQNRLCILPPALSGIGLAQQSKLGSVSRYIDKNKYYTKDLTLISKDFENSTKGKSENSKIIYGLQDIFNEIKEQPFEYLKLMYIKFNTMWRIFPGGGGIYDKKLYIIFCGLFNIPIFFLSLFGMVISFNHWRRTLILIFWIITVTLPHLIFAAKPNYRLPVMPFLILFMAFTITSLYQRFYTFK